MNIERMKSVVLTLLVAISLFLTVALWNYQPQYYEEIENTRYLYESRLNGQSMTMDQLITPSRVIFHESNSHFGLEDQRNLGILFKEMKKWPIEHFDHYTLSGREVKKPNVEVIFPTELPLSVLHDILAVQEQEVFPEWEFDRIFFHLVKNESSIEVIFASSMHNQTLNAEIQSSEAYSYLARYFNNKDLLIELIPFVTSEESEPIYLPASEIELPERTFTINKLQTKPIINAIFNDPSLVETSITNFGERIYTDGTRQLSIFNHYMSFINPLTADNQQMEKQNLIRKSINFINDHHGWTNMFRLSDIKENTNTVVYQMTMDDYPVFHRLASSYIEISWRNQQIYEYNRPLLKLVTPFSSEGQMVTLRSGQDIIYYLEHNRNNYFPFLIEDIQIGYTMKEKEGFNSIMLLEPEWYIKYNGRWQPLLYSFDGTGGEMDAMEPN
ncbi:MAG: hypothetical protein H0Z32_04300 [Bacillaceae bacterium]|nr:hypothetical protein [Bacillaceae bacterium]